MSEINNKEEKVKVFSLISIIIFMVVLVMPALIWGIGNVIASEKMEVLDYDLGEKREKASFPEHFTSSYGTELEAYYNDRLPFRSVIIVANRKLTATVEKPYNEVISPYLVKTFYSDYNKEKQVAFAEETTEDAMSESIKTDLNEQEIAVDTGKKSLNAESGDITEDDVTETEVIEKTPDEGQTEEVVSEEVAEDETIQSQDATDAEAMENNDESIINVEEETTSVEPTYMPPRVFNENTIEGRDGWLFFAKEYALEDYLGTNILTDEQMNEYVSGMVRLQNICNAQGKQLYFIIPPNKEIVYSEKMPSYTIMNEYRRGERLVDYIHANSDIKLIYPIKELRDAKTEWQPYFRTDTHWTELGAFIGVQSLYSMMGLPVTNLHNLSISQQEYLGGDLVGLGNLNQEDYRGDIRYQIQYKPDITVGSIDGSQVVDWIYRANSTSSNQCNVVVIGDSFRLFMSNYMAKDFSNYTHVHWKYLEEPIAKEAFKNADIIIIESVERFNWTMLNTLSSVSNTLES